MIGMLRAKRLLMVLALATLFARCAAAQGSNYNLALAAVCLLAAGSQGLERMNALLPGKTGAL
ncbi:MAG: hypothetical protein ABSE79_01550 [Terriglobia bacterium]|jgi:hypothetical protein